MKRVKKTMAIVIFMAAAATAFAQDRVAAKNAAPDAQQAVIRLEHRWLANENKPAVLESILGDDFVHVVPEGMISKREHIDYVKAHPNAFPGVHKFEQLEVRVYGSTAIANGVVLALPPGGPPHRALFTDVFTFRQGRWQAVNAQETPMASGDGN
ncbi:MAG TPA: nuclear transport factor 2 family protein [Candidatus Acidoferrales bacterium]|nr:nuclear transport factor 2 family protein [Candidatus Acidoferrales bacterium]